jgi:Arc/MetJ-type ribon-helix-helix transcriptional regulator
MSKRVTVNLPDDVAERLGQESNASAYVTAALRREIDRERGLAALAEHFGAGILSDESRARGRARLAGMDARWTPERRENLRRRMRPGPVA